MTNSSSALGEFERIERYFKPLAAGFPAALGLSDDAAVIDVPDGMQLVVTTDAMVAGEHFLATDPPADVAAKLLRVNLSDLAAMAARPFGYTLVTALPRDLDQSWLAAFAAGLGEDQRRFGVGLLGGDSVAIAGPITLTLAGFGLVPRGRALTRRTSNTTDPIFVTGTIGDAALGLAIVLGTLDVADSGDRAALIQRLRRPEPRVSLSEGLRDLAGAAIDVSDGLIADLGHLCEVSGCAAIIDTLRVPLSAATRAVLAGQPRQLEMVLTGGDDYELLFSAAAEHRAALAQLAVRVGVAITEIGHLEPGPPGQVAVVGPGGRPLAITRTGWQHF